MRHLRQQLVGNPHQQQLRQPPDEYLLHPRRHFVRARLPVVDVQHHDRDDDAESDQQHGEQEVLAEQRQCERCRRYDFRDQEEEHRLRQENGDAECDLLSGVGGQVEDEDREVGDTDARNDQVDRVEESLPAESDVEEDI